MEKDWKIYQGKYVRLLIEDFNSFPKPRDGVIISVTPTHLFLKIEGKDLPVPFLLTTIRRVDIKEEING
jgi:ribosome maturation factor RimP